METGDPKMPDPSAGEVTRVRLTWEDQAGNRQFGCVDIPGRPAALIGIELFYDVRLCTEPIDLASQAAADVLEGLGDNSYLDLFRAREEP